MPTLSAPTLIDFATRILRAHDVPEPDAAIVARSLVSSNLRGHDSHGLLRLPQYIGFLDQGIYQPVAKLTVEVDTPAVVVCDGGWGLGQVQAHRLLDLIEPKAKSLGIAAGAMRDAGHIGRLGEYAERAAEQGLVLIATANNGGAGQRVAPPGGTQPRLGTNPLCMGVPIDSSDPVVLDFGTSVVAEGKVRSHNVAGTTVPLGWVLDPDGHPTTDPGVLYRVPSGSILPMGGEQSYKGFGLALLLDLLSGGLSGGRCSYPDAGPARGNNTLFVLLDPAHFAGADALQSRAACLSDYVRETPLREGVERILLPGDPERDAFKRRSGEGIPLPQGHWDLLVATAEKLGVTAPVPSQVASIGPV